MSITATSWAWESSSAEGTDLLVLLAVADWASQHDDDPDEKCWPSIAKIAKRVRVSSRTVQRSLKALAASGDVVVTDHPSWTGRPDRAPNAYIIPVRRGDTLTPRDHERGDNDDTNGVTRMSPNTKERETELSLGSSDPDQVEPGFGTNGLPLSLQQLPPGIYPEQFTITWGVYPQPRRKEKRGTYAAWRASVVREVRATGDEPIVVMRRMYRAALNYGRTVKAEVDANKRQWQHVKLAATFFGPSDAWKDYENVQALPKLHELGEWEA